MCSMRVGFSPSISSNSDSASGFDTRGSTPLISPQPDDAVVGLDLHEHGRADPGRPHLRDLDGGGAVLDLRGRVALLGDGVGEQRLPGGERRHRASITSRRVVGMGRSFRLQRIANLHGAIVTFGSSFAAALPSAVMRCRRGSACGGSSARPGARSRRPSPCRVERQFLQRRQPGQVSARPRRRRRR